MNATYTWLDWSVFAAYFALLIWITWYFSREKANNTQDYFLGGNKMPIWVVAISVLATSQSAATFLGAPDQGYQNDLTYLATNIGAFIAAFFVAIFLIPKFYQNNVSTVYELLEQRFGAQAKRQAGLMYLMGRVFASGARLYMAALAVAMILFGNIEASSVIIGIVILTIVGLGYSVKGGICAVIYSDAIQCAVYIIAALFVVYFLYSAIPADFGQIVDALNNPHDRELSKLTVFNFNVDFSSAGVFNIWSALTGFVLLNIAAFGLDQDMTQRVLTCKNAKEGSKAMVWSVIMVVPVMALFIAIGLLLYVFYQRPDLMASDAAGLVQSFEGEKITVFMSYILNEIPPGVRGLVTVGVIAAALSTLNSGLNSMSSVLVQDIYRPWHESKNKATDPRHYVKAGQAGMVLAALALSGMAILCFYWQQYTDMPLLAFALSVMVFSYSGLLGVYFTVLFTKRGNKHSVLSALIVGFVTTLFFQPYILSGLANLLSVPDLANINLGFTWQLCIGTLAAFITCCLGSKLATVETESKQCAA